MYFSVVLKIDLFNSSTVNVPFQIHFILHDALLLDKFLVVCGLCNGLFFFPVLQALIAELSIVDSTMNEYKSENEILAKELENIKKKYFLQKKLHR